MNCQQCNRLLVPLIHNLLAEERRQAVIAHIKSCPSCLAEFKAVKSLHDRLTTNGHAVAQKSLEDAVWGTIAQKDSARISAAMAARASEDGAWAAARATEVLSRRRSIMTSQFSKFAAAAAVIIVGCLLGYVFLFGPTTKPSIADVIRKINLVKSFAYKMNMEMDGLADMVGQDKMVLENDVIMAPELGMRVDSYNEGKLMVQTYISMVDANALTIMPSEKKYMRMKFGDELVSQMRKQNNDPRMMLEEFNKCSYVELGESEIDGVKVVGFESTDPNIVQNMLGNVSARVWVDQKTNLIVKYELEASDIDGKKTMSLTLEDFQWDLDLDTTEFIAEIPDDYEMMADVNVAVTPETLAEGLKFYCELTGRYPREMNPISMAKDLQQGLMNKFANMPKPENPEELQKDIMQKTMNLTMSMTFYGTLKTEGKDPAYYGDKVTPDFPDAVLVRWLGEDGKYVVIFGDCSLGEATAEELKALEEAPLNPNPHAMVPSPENGQTSVVTDGVVLSWVPGANVTEHKVYLGTDAQALELLAEVSGDTNTPSGQLLQNTTYYWRVDEVQNDGSVAPSAVWNFTTGGLVAHYKFDDAGGTNPVDSADNPVEARFLGDPTWTTGHIGGALEFDGDDCVGCGMGSVTKFEITDKITVSAWIKVDTFDKPWQAIVTKGDKAWRLQRNNEADTLEFGCYGLIIDAQPYGSVKGNIPVNDGNWHHALGVYDGKRIALYVDGRVDVEVNVVGSISINRGFPVLIGANSEKNNRYWKGLIDDVRIYNCALSEEEIQALAR